LVLEIANPPAAEMVFSCACEQRDMSR